MKLIGVMSLKAYRDHVRKVFEKHDIKIYSELEITGHTTDTIKRYGWWSLDTDVPLYSTMYFAIVKKEKADALMNDISCLEGECDPDHTPKAFQIDVEKMV